MEPTFLLITVGLWYLTTSAFCGQITVPVGSNNTIPDELRDMMHGVKMGVRNSRCDDGESNLDVDYGGTASEYTCSKWTRQKMRRVKNLVLKPVLTCYKIDPHYRPPHFCMNRKIIYDTFLPTHEGHRPLWPVYGEYRYLPPQRWLHNIEHGAVVMLYHPCTPARKVERLRFLVKSCLRKYIISPYKGLKIVRPLALVAWGCSFEMDYVNKSAVVAFIKFLLVDAKEAAIASAYADGGNEQLLLSPLFKERKAEESFEDLSTVYRTFGDVLCKNSGEGREKRSQS